MVSIVAIIKNKLKANTIKGVIDAVTRGELEYGLNLYNKLNTSDQEVIKTNLSKALTDCGQFLDTSNNYRGDRTTAHRISVLIYSYQFANTIKISDTKLDTIVAELGELTPTTLIQRLELLRHNPEKTTNVTIIKILPVLDPSTPTHPSAPKTTAIPNANPG